MRVAVVGCGTGGPAAALLLNAAGHDVEIFERFNTPSPIGAGLLLQPTGQAVLARLGLLRKSSTAQPESSASTARPPTGAW